MCAEWEMIQLVIHEGKRKTWPYPWELREGDLLPKEPGSEWGDIATPWGDLV